MPSIRLSAGQPATWASLLPVFESLINLASQPDAPGQVKMFAHPRTLRVNADRLRKMVDFQQLACKQKHLKGLGK